MIRWLENNRRIVLTFLAVAVWFALCLPPLLQNKPDAFQAAGSVIVAMAVLIYARERARRENDVAEAQRSQIVALLDEHEKWGTYHELKARRSGIESDLKFLRFELSHGTDKQGKAKLASRISELESDLGKTDTLHQQYYDQMQASQVAYASAHDSAEETVRKQAPTAKALERLEIALVVFGTLQWGYGDHWVRWLHGVI